MTSVLFNNFVRGKLDTDLNGRFDLSIFSNGFPKIENFISNYKGVLKYRPGFEYVAMTRASKLPSKLIEFRFNTDQTYLLECTDEHIRFYTYDADGNFGNVSNENGDILELETTEYTYNTFNKSQHSQNADVMVFVSPNHQPYELTRKGATSFVWETARTTGIDEETMGYPSAVAFHKGRLWYGGFKNKPTTIVGSGFADYGNFTIKTTDIVDTDPVQFTLTDISDKIKWLYGGKKNLIAGNAEGISTINGGSVDTPITATKINADLSNKASSSACVPTEKDSQVIYVGVDKERVYSFDYDFMSESFVSSDLNLISENVGKIEELYYKRDNNNLIYGRTSDGQMIALLYNKAENIVGWFPIKTQGKVVSMCTVTRPDGKDDLFICVKRGEYYYIERLSDEVNFSEFDELSETKEEFHKKQFEELSTANYLDSSVSVSGQPVDFRGYFAAKTTGTEVMAYADYHNVITEEWIGRRIKLSSAVSTPLNEFISSKEEGTISQILYNDENEAVGFTLTNDTFSGMGIIHSISIPVKVVGDLDDIEGQEQDVFADGGYVGTFKVENGQIELNGYYDKITIGFGYKGIAKTFNIGSWYQGVNYQTAKKRVISFTVRLLNSASVKIGTSIDNMQALQEFKPDGFYDKAPLLVNGDVMVHGYNDIHSTNKSVYILQDEPTPCCITMIDCEVSFNKMR